MFQEIRLDKVGQFKQPISKAFISKKGIIVIATLKRKIAMFHESAPGNVIYLDSQLEKNYSYKAKKVKEIEQIHESRQVSSQTTLFILLDQIICLVCLQLIAQGNHFHIQLKQMKVFNDILKGVSEHQQQTRFSAELIGIKNGIILFSILVYNIQIKILSFKVDTEAQTLNLQLILNLTIVGADYAQQNLIRSLWMEGFKAKWFQQYLLFFDQAMIQGHQNILCISDLSNCKQDDKFRFQSIHQLPDREDISLIKDIQVSSVNKSIDQASILLFYQYPQYLQIVQVSLKNPKIRMQSIKHPHIILYKLIQSSFTPEAVEIKGLNYCRDNNTFLAHIRFSLNFQDRLVIIGSPLAHRSLHIINEVALPKNTLCVSKGFDQNIIVCKDQILSIKLISKASIYQFMLENMGIQALGRIIEQVLQ